ncbi:Histone deacetylase [Apophysomyces ossiformis]|uniref:histone deacetylase n=1 Tax=Apophysomyces ossiformis TaxID=679940 RepID=A0A8H7BLN6_9FUNG|nr:Histone deacetylase [Apophysomyces ossiformis]
MVSSAIQDNVSIQPSTAIDQSSNGPISPPATTDVVLKKRRPGRPSKKELKERSKQKDQQPDHHYDDNHLLYKRRRTRTLRSTSENNVVHPINFNPSIASSSYSVGDQVEAIKITEESKEWYIARVVELLRSSDESDDRVLLVLVHYEGWPPEQADWVNPSDIRLPISSARYGSAGKESEDSWKGYADFYYSKVGTRIRQHTGLVHDRQMSLHTCPCHSRKTIHPERPERIASIFQALRNNRLLRYFRRLDAREATTEELLHVHTFAHVRNYYPIHQTITDENNHTSDTPTPIKITSIAALLNHPTSPPLTRPSQRHGSIIGPTCGVGGGEVVKVDQDRIRRQQRRFSNASDTAIPISPPELVYQMSCGELGIAVDTTFHPLHSSISARIAAGALINLVDQIVQGHLRNGFALIRPPGHHAEDDSAMGFCFFNNVAVAAAATLDKYPSKIRKVLVLDWDIHHGNGTQKIFYDNPNVLYVSLHRWDQGRFYPFSGAPNECGEGAGLGRNVNIAFSVSEEKPRPMGDTEFVAAIYHIVTPIAQQFAPDMIFVSAGFDAAEGHPENLGGYHVTPRGFALMTKMVKDLAEELCQGRLVLSLEGGYELQPLANSAAASIAQLLPPEELPEPALELNNAFNGIKPNQGAVESLKDVIRIQQQFWEFPPRTLSPTFRFHLPIEWRATDSIATRPKRDKRPIKVPVIEGY